MPFLDQRALHFIQVVILVMGMLPAKVISSVLQPEKIDSKLDSNLLFQMRVHGFLLWSSLGFLTPLGILVIRLSNGEGRSKRLKLFFYSHLVLQIISVFLVMTAAVLSIRNFENSFRNYHQRIGLALYAGFLLQPLIAFCRPRSGVKGRRTWYMMHWSIGTGICALGIINIYTGLYAYNIKTSKVVSLWIVLFTAEIVFMAFLYLLQDKWEYIKKQDLIKEDALNTTNQQFASNRNNLKI